MSKHPQTPRIKAYMTPTPHTIGVDQTLDRAHAIMHQHRLRHLPVLAGGRLVGIVSDRDLQMVETFRDVDPRTVRVEEAMSQDVYTVTPDTPLDEVVHAMATHKFGSTLVVERDHVVGIFTTVDVCRAFVDVLRARAEPTA